MDPLPRPCEQGRGGCRGTRREGFPPAPPLLGFRWGGCGGDLKGKLSPVFYALAIGLAFVRPWLVPDRRIEWVVSEAEGGTEGKREGKREREKGKKARADPPR